MKSAYSVVKQNIVEIWRNNGICVEGVDEGAVEGVDEDAWLWKEFSSPENDARHIIQSELVFSEGGRDD